MERFDRRHTYPPRRQPRASLIVAVAFVAAALASGTAAFKFHALAVGVYPPGARIPISMPEFNIWLQAEIPAIVGDGVRNARVETAAGNIVRGYADIDFLKVRQAAGEKPNWILSQLLVGERPVVITVRITSANGKCRVDPVRVSISGVVAEGRTLDFLITNFVLPNFPDAKIGKDFALAYNIDRLEVRPGTVTVVVRSR